MRGSIDSLLQMAEIARDAQVHFHVDAAWVDHCSSPNNIDINLRALSWPIQ